MNPSTTSIVFRLEPESNERLVALCGEYDENLKQIEEHFGIGVSHRGHLFYLNGNDKSVNDAEKVLRALYDSTNHELEIRSETVHLALSQVPRDSEKLSPITDEVSVRVRKLTIRGQNQHQRDYLLGIKNHKMLDILKKML